MAMIDAGYPMRCTMCSVTCAIMDTGNIQLDPTLDQEKVCTNVIK
jgi:ribonuclease PH